MGLDFEQTFALGSSSQRHGHRPSIRSAPTTRRRHARPHHPAQLPPPRSPATPPLPADLRPELAAALASRGVDRLYTHQADAYRHVLAGRHLVVVTPTASGQTLCYNLPVLQGLLERPDSRALYLFPTTAREQAPRG